MKKSYILQPLFILFVTLLLLQPLHAVLITDIDAIWIDLGKEKSVNGGGLSLLWDMPRYFDEERILFYINTTYASDKKNHSDGTETVRSYLPVTFGVEYRYQIFQIPLYITGTAGAGYSYFKRESPSYELPLDTSKTVTDSASGAYTDFMIGLNYITTNNTSIFVKSGYHKAFYNDDTIESPAGFQFAAGFRFPLSGTFRGLGGVEDVYSYSAPMKLPDKGIRRSRGGKTRIEISPLGFIPIDKFGEITKPGGGGMFSLTRDDFFISGFSSGLQVGFFNIQGKDEIDTEGMNTHSFKITPFAVTTGYPFKLFSNLSITPTLALGGAYINTEYTTRDLVTLEDTEKTSKGVDPMISGDLSLDYLISGSLVLGIKAGYTVLIENDMTLQFATCGINTGIRF